MTKAEFITHGKELVKKGRGVDFPFQLEVEGKVLTCLQPLRILPGKRLTVLGEWDSQQVVAKIFVDPRSWRRHSLRELNGCRILDKSGIDTPPVITYQPFAEKKMAVLLSSFIREGVNLSSLVTSIDDEKLEYLVKEIMEQLGLLHQLGITHGDLHLDNFLIKGGQIFLLDGDQVREYPREVSLEDGLDNVAQLFGHFPWRQRPVINKLLRDYFHSRQITFDPSRREQFSKAVIRVSKNQIAEYAEKVLRECTAVRARRGMTEFSLHNRKYLCTVTREQLDNFLDDPETKLIKKGNTCTIGHLQAWVVKRYNIKDFWHGLRRCFRKSRAMVSWCNAHVLTKLGIATPTPVACIEQRWGWVIRRKAYFISEYVAGETLDQVIARGELTTQISEQVVELLWQIYSIGFRHGDLKATNILITAEDAKILDLDGMFHCHNKAKLIKRWKKDLCRFQQNWLEKTQVKNLFHKLLVEKGFSL